MPNGTQSLNTAHAVLTLDLANNVVTSGLDNRGSDPESTTYRWDWNGTGVAPSATFAATFTFSNGGMAINCSNGVYTYATYDMRVGLYDASTDAALSGNPTPRSNYLSIPTGSDDKIKVEAPETLTLTTTLPAPTTFYGPKMVRVTLKSQAYASTTIANYGATSTAHAKSGEHSVTLDSSSLTYTP